MFPALEKKKQIIAHVNKTRISPTVYVWFNTKTNRFHTAPPNNANSKNWCLKLVSKEFEKKVGKTGNHGTL